MTLNNSRIQNGIIALLLCGILSACGSGSFSTKRGDQGSNSGPYSGGYSPAEASLREILNDKKYAGEQFLYLRTSSLNNGSLPNQLIRALEEFVEAEPDHLSVQWIETVRESRVFLEDGESLVACIRHYGGGGSGFVGHMALSYSCAFSADTWPGRTDLLSVPAQLFLSLKQAYETYGDSGEVSIEQIVYEELDGEVLREVYQLSSDWEDEALICEKDSSQTPTYYSCELNI